MLFWQLLTLSLETPPLVLEDLVEKAVETELAANPTFWCDLCNNNYILAILVEFLRRD